MPDSGPSPKSSGVTFTRSAPLIFSWFRANSLIPLVTTPPASDAAATTSPPGQTQKEKAERPLGRWQESL